MGRGAIMAPISTLKVSSRRLGAFSHRPPPCMMAEIMLTGAENWMRSSTAGEQEGLRAAARGAGGADRCRDSLRAAIRRKSTARIEFHSCRPSGPKSQSCSAGCRNRAASGWCRCSPPCRSEDDVALPREIDAARRHGGEHGVLQPAVVPVAVRRDDRGEAAGRRGFQRAIEIAAEIVAGHGLEQHLLDGVRPVLDAAEDLRVQGVLRRHGQQAGGGENLLAQMRAPRLPFRQRLVGARGEVRIGIRECRCCARPCAGSAPAARPQSSRVSNVRMASRSEGPDSFDGLVHASSSCLRR